MHTTTAASAIPLTNPVSTAARCTAVTEFFNQTLRKDFFFLGITTDCSGPGTSGCVVSRSPNVPNPASVDIPGGPSGIVVDNYDTNPQASSIYFMADKADFAYKYTQEGLQ
jgi:hypothetical protein